MKVKIGTVLEEDVLRMLKARAVKEQRSISDVIQGALVQYFHAGTRHRDERLAAVERLCSRPFNLDASQIRELLNEDYREK